MKEMKSAYVLLALALLGVTPVSRPADNASSVLADMLARNPSLRSFQSRVHVNVRMLNFPWLAPRLDGTAYFKRPDNYEVVFDRVPSYAHGLTKLFGVVDDPALWMKDDRITFAGVTSVGGKQAYALDLTAKIRSDQVKNAIAYVDARSFHVVRMRWNYYNGGSIVMTQQFKQQGRYTVVAAQHAEIAIPHVRAIADASYGMYQTNVAVRDSVFASR
jgi:outer membrane lipoprotein-sorting protein